MQKRAQFAVAYLRTSSAANIGPDKDCDKRQRAAIEAFAKRAGFTIVGEYYDAAVSGADPVDKRAGFADMLQHLAANGAKTIIVESPDRFARDLAVQLGRSRHAQVSRALDHSRFRSRFFYRGNANRHFGTPGARGYRTVREGQRSSEIGSGSQAQA